MNLGHRVAEELDETSLLSHADQTYNTVVLSMCLGACKNSSKGCIGFVVFYDMVYIREYEHYAGNLPVQTVRS